MTRAFSIAASLVTIVLMSPASPAGAQQSACKPAVKIDAAAWSDPHPDTEDVGLVLGSLPGAVGEVKLVLRKVPVSGTSFFGDEKSVFKAGTEAPTLFEPRVALRAASALSDTNRNHFLLAGKYEISTAQFAFVMGEGDLAKGIRGTALATTGPLQSFAAADGACSGVVTEEVAQALALPVTGVTETEFRHFIKSANEMCFASEACAKVLAGLSNNPQIPANLRLPAGYEWEYVARGGAADGPATQMPVPPAGSAIRDIANIKPVASSGSAALRQIGTTKPYLGLYDIFGNAQELTAGFLMAETVSGAVGGLQARGGSIASDESDLRPSAVTELKPYAAAENGMIETPLALTGMRLFVGSPLAGATSRLGSDELVRIYAAAFSEIGTGKDRAGNSFVDAKPMREMKPQGEAFEDELDASDPADVFRFPLTMFANATARIKSSAPVVVDIFDEARRPIVSFDAPASATAETTEKALPALLPGRYYVSVKPKSAPAEGTEITYGLTMLADKPLDTGLSGAEIGREAFSGKQQKMPASGLLLEGYVGTDDPFDTYAVELPSGFDAMSFEVQQASANVEMRLLDSRGQKIQGRLMDGSVESSYPAPLPLNAKVFVQVAAVDGQPTRYVVKAVPSNMFGQGLRLSNNGEADAAASRELQGFLHEGAKTLYYKTRLPERRKLRAELTGLDADVDLAVLDAAGQAIASSHRQTGSEPEVFAKDLPAGDYLVQLNRKSGSGTIAPFNLAVLQEQAVELGVADLKAFKDRAIRVSVGQTGDIKPPGGVVYYYFDAPSVLQAYDITINTYGRSTARVTLETADGATLAVQDDVKLETLKYFGGPSSGRTYIRLEFKDAPPSGMLLYIRSAGAVPGRDTGYVGGSKAGDWTYGAANADCFAYTHATDFSPPQGWVKERPYFLITVSKGGSGAFISVADEADFDTAKSPSVKVRDAKGKQRAVSLVWHNNFLKPVSYDKGAKQYFLNSGAIRQIVSGQDILLDGKTKSGLPAKLSYSLKGIGEATRALVKLCKMKNNVFN